MPVHDGREGSHTKRRGADAARKDKLKDVYSGVFEADEVKVGDKAAVRSAAPPSMRRRTHKVQCGVKDAHTDSHILRGACTSARWKCGLWYKGCGGRSQMGGQVEGGKQMMIKGGQWRTKMRAHRDSHAYSYAYVRDDGHRRSTREHVYSKYIL